MASTECFIKIDSIILFNCEVQLVDIKGTPEYNLRLTHLSRNFSEDHKVMNFLVSFDLMKDIEKPVFAMKASYLIIYSRPEDKGMSWIEFSDSIAIAHAIPYLREFISNMTSRMQLNTLHIPPINAFFLVEEYNKENSKTLSNS